jgi:hypothetical protein
MIILSQIIIFFFFQLTKQKSLVDSLHYKKRNVCNLKNPFLFENNLKIKEYGIKEKIRKN